MIFHLQRMIITISVNEFYFTTSISCISRLFRSKQIFRLGKVSSNFNILCFTPSYRLIWKRNTVHVFFHSWKETRSFSLLLETRLNGIENKCRERNIYIYIYIYRGGGTARWACSYNAVTSVNRTPGSAVGVQRRIPFAAISATARQIEWNCNLEINRRLFGQSRLHVSSRIANLHRILLRSCWETTDSPPSQSLFRIRSKSESLIFMISRDLSRILDLDF